MKKSAKLCKWDVKHIQRGKKCQIRSLEGVLHGKQVCHMQIFFDVMQHCYKSYKNSRIICFHARNNVFRFMLKRNVLAFTRWTLNQLCFRVHGGAGQKLWWERDLTTVPILLSFLGHPKNYNENVNMWVCASKRVPLSPLYKIYIKGYVRPDYDFLLFRDELVWN